MFLFVLAYIGGVLTILSPCILPVLPFVFSRLDQPFAKGGLPVLISMIFTFAIIAMLGVTGGHWIVEINQYGRWLAMVLLLLFAMTLMSKQVADGLMRPFVILGDRLNQRISFDEQVPSSLDSLVSSLLVGVATGLLWAPCAGPILGLILTYAAVKGAGAQTVFLLVMYASGAATSIAIALFAGKPVLNFLKRTLGIGDRIRQALGVAVLVGVVAIASGLDTGFLTRLSQANTSLLEQRLLDKFHLAKNTPKATSDGRDTNAHAIPDVLQRLEGATTWLNSAPLTHKDLKNKVVLIDFWTYSCINCLRSLPYVEAWADKYKKQGLVVIGVHTPEFGFEKDKSNVQRAVHELKLSYPIAMDNDYAIWQAFDNQYWPAHYLIDIKGKIRHQHFGEGEYDNTERIIQELLKEAGKRGVSQDIASVKQGGVFEEADLNDVQSPETYLGYLRSEHFASNAIKRDQAVSYTQPDKLGLNQWGLSGIWNVHDEKVVLDRVSGSIVYRFHARDVHLVMGSSLSKPIRFRVKIDHHSPGFDHGTDIDSEGWGSVKEQRLYQLIRQKQHPVSDHTFEIEFMGKGVEVFAFTFG